MKTRRLRMPDPQRRELKRILREGGLGAAFQPIVDLSTGRPAGIEALCRPVSTGLFTCAGDLFQAAERLRMLWPLELEARRSAIATLGRWSHDARLFMNCSPQVVSDLRFVCALDLAISACEGLHRDRLVIEITERADHRITPALRRRVCELKALGFGIAIDDVGAGMSGLNRIMELRPHWLKLDMALVRRIDADPYRRKLVRAIATFASDCQIKLVAEGIESEAELETIREVGVDYAQGFHLARPLDCIADVPAVISCAPGITRCAA